jgi:hypothetical protein
MPGFTKNDFSKRWLDYESSRVMDAFLGAVQSHYPNNFIALKNVQLGTLAEKLDQVAPCPKLYYHLLQCVY